GDSLDVATGRTAQVLEVRAGREAGRQALAVVVQEIDDAGAVRHQLADLRRHQVEDFRKAPRRSEGLGDLIERVDLPVRRRYAAQDRGLATDDGAGRVPL